MTDAPSLPELQAIAHATDFGPASELAFAHALKIALGAKTRFWILHTDHVDPERIDWDAFPGVRATLERWGLLPPGSDAKAVAEELGVKVGKIDLIDRSAVRGILSFLEDHQADLLVLGSHGREGLARFLQGSVAEPVARQAHVPTLFVPEGARGFVDPATGAVRLKRILAPVTHAPRPEPALALAWELAALLDEGGAVFHGLYVGSGDDVPVVESEGLPMGRLDIDVRAGNPVEAIAAAAAELDADLIVMATAGHQNLLDRLTGSTTEQVVRRARRPVLAVPA